MKVKEFCRIHKRTILGIGLASVLTMILAGGVIFYCLRGKSGRDGGFLQGGRGGLPTAQLENMTAASGVTSVGVSQISFGVENLTEELVVEEVYVASNDVVQEGDELLKLTEESVHAVREELEQTLREADLACRAGAIAYEQSKIEAEYERDSAVLSGRQARQVYDETVSGLSSALERAKKELEEAQEQIAEYESYVNDNSYRSYYKVDELQALYDENLELLQDKMEEWGVGWQQVTGQGGQGAGLTQTDAAQGGAGASSGQVQVLSSLYKVLEQNLKDADQAQSDYEDALTNASFELQTLELRLPSLQQAVTEARESYETRILEAGLTYENSLANAERAEKDYETAVQKAESDYETLKDDYEDAKENLELFERSVGDGYFYAPGNGTILRMMMRAEQKMTSGTVIFIYSNPQEISVTVSVDQADIAGITVGDSAYIRSASGGGYDGTVTQMNPVSASDSRTNVTYDVTVTLSGEAGELGANEAVTVVFGEESIEMLKEMMNSAQTGTAPGEESVPVGGSGEGTAPEEAPGEDEAPQGAAKEDPRPDREAADGENADSTAGEMPEQGSTAKGGYGVRQNMPEGTTMASE